MTKERVEWLIVTDGPLVTADDGSAGPRTGAGLSALGTIKGGALAIDDGRIVAVGPSREVRARYAAADTLLVGEALITPGLIDAHTHPVFGATRADEFAMRVAGRTYQEIAAAGGGILNSARALATLGQTQLILATRARFDRFLAHGTTTIEAKSGYGLSPEAERLSLLVLWQLGLEHPLETARTLLAAHAVPEAYAADRAAYLAEVVERLIPQVASDGLAEFCDAFCDEGAFSVAECERVLAAAKTHGLRPRLHTDEFAAIGGCELAARLGAISADHLHVITDEGIAALKAGGVMPVLLPGTSFFLGLRHHAPARKLVEAGLPIVLATDFNPGSSHVQSLSFIMTLAAVTLGLSPAEALIACTVNAAHAIGRGERLGRLRVGAQADLVVWDVPSVVALPYAVADNRVHAVFKRGCRVVPAPAARVG